MENPETNIRICKVCRIPKQRISAGKYNAKDKKYVDETGKTWNGSTCSQCSSARLKNYMRSKRNEIA